MGLCSLLVGMSPPQASYRSSCWRSLAQRALAALRADSDLSSGVIFAARALPPFKPPRLPSSTAAGFFFSVMRESYPERSRITRSKLA
jgi:hypothetical protein